MCVCVRERERARERESDGEKRFPHCVVLLDFENDSPLARQPRNLFVFPKPRAFSFHPPRMFKAQSRGCDTWNSASKGAVSFCREPTGEIGGPFFADSTLAFLRALWRKSGTKNRRCAIFREYTFPTSCAGTSR